MSTQKAVFSYEEVIDLHTEADRVSVIGIHTPTGDTPRKLCPGFFQQFKKYKYMGCKVALVPAATLPADPQQISYESAEPAIDPRDMLNPILFHGCHGNDLGDILNRLYAANAVTGDGTTMHLGSDAVDMVSYLNGDLFEDWDSLDANISFMESLYYRALTDRTWKKANIQRGFRIAGLRPRVYSLASTMQIMGVASLDNIGKVPAPFEIDGEWTGSIQSGIEGTVDIDNPLSNANRFLTPRTIPLGWLDTRNVLTFRDPASVQLEDDDIGLAPNVINTMVKQGTVPVELPKIFMGVILLPPAYKQEFYFRMIVTHFFAFAGFRGVSMSNDMLENPNYHDWNEQITDGQGDESTPDPDPPEPEPVGSQYVLTDLYSSGAPNISVDGVTTPYNTYEELWYGGQYHGTVDVSLSDSPFSGSTVELAYFCIPQSVALNPSVDGDPIGYFCRLVNGSFQYEFVGYNDVVYMRNYNGSSWGNWAVRDSGNPVFSVVGDDFAITSVDIGGTTKYNFEVAE